MKRLTVAATLLIAGIITYGTLSPPDADPGLLPFTDKQLHFLAFAVLVFPLSWIRPRRVFWIVGLALCFGAMIEIIQPLVGRSQEWGDFLADALGIVAGVLPGQFRERVRRVRL